MGLGKLGWEWGIEDWVSIGAQPSCSHEGVVRRSWCGRVVWAVADPGKFLKRNLKFIAGSYHLALDMGKWDPQKISKNPASHEFAVNEFRRSLYEERNKANQ